MMRLTSENWQELKRSYGEMSWQWVTFKCSTRVNYGYGFMSNQNVDTHLESIAQSNDVLGFIVQPDQPT